MQRIDQSDRLGAGYITAERGTAEHKASQNVASQNAASQNTASLNVQLHTSTVNVVMGKSQDVRTDRAYADITVGNPDVADASPLTDHSISILGKKIGTTRVSVYDQDKRPVGIFDVEVSYDVTRLSVEVARISHGSIRVSPVDGRVLLSGTSPDAVTLDKVVQLARQFAPDVINTVEVTEAQQVMLEVRFIEASRQASRELGVQWNVFGHSVLANVGNNFRPRSYRSPRQTVRFSKPRSAALALVA